MHLTCVWLMTGTAAQSTARARSHRATIPPWTAPTPLQTSATLCHPVRCSWSAAELADHFGIRQQRAMAILALKEPPPPAAWPAPCCSAAILAVSRRWPSARTCVGSGAGCADPVAVVGPRWGIVDAAHVYGGFTATLGTWCEKHGVPMEAYPVGAIKKHWTGAGNASKEAMIAAAVRRGFKPIDDNEADALAMLDMALGGLVL